MFILFLSNLELLYLKTHIFDGVEEWPTHLLYLTGDGICGWHGSLEENDYYQQLKRENHPAKMLAVAEHWLRKEVEENRMKRNQEDASGEFAYSLDPTQRQGGYASGRNLPLIFN
jgi:hypothetical protein